MGWMASIVVALLTGALGLIGAGIVASACVTWYNVSSFEGKAGYAVVGVALLGGMAGLVIGLVTARLVAAGHAPGFLRAIAFSCGIVVVAAALIAAVAWALADIPPEIDGQLLDLAVELRLPAGENAPPAPSEETYITLGSASGGVVRATRRGELDLGAARQEAGRWIVPGRVFVFTTRGARVLDLVIGGETRAGFLVPLPRRPRPANEAWSDWLPHPRPGDPPWPDSKASYRFRVQRILPPAEPPDPEVVAAETFAALAPEAPLAEWLPFIGYDQPDGRVASAMAVVEGRQDDLAEAVGSADADLRERALTAVSRLTRVEPAVAGAVLAEGRAIADAVRAFNAMPAEDPDFFQVQVDLRGRFSRWHRAWWTVHRRTGIDGRPPVQEISDLAAARTQGTTMDEIVVNARAHLEGIAKADGAAR